MANGHPFLPYSVLSCSELEISVSSSNTARGSTWCLNHSVAVNSVISISQRDPAGLADRDVVPCPTGCGSLLCLARVEGFKPYHVEFKSRNPRGRFPMCTLGSTVLCFCNVQMNSQNKGSMFLEKDRFQILNSCCKPVVTITCANVCFSEYLLNVDHCLCTMQPSVILHGIDVSHSVHMKNKKVLKAVEFAARAHDGQFRKTGQPYVSHCLETALIFEELLSPTMENSRYVYPA